MLTKFNELPESVRVAVRNNVGGHANHSLFWRILGPKGGGAPSGVIGDAITRQFGSFDDMKKQFNDAAMKRFGSGWAWICVNGDSMMIQSTANQESPLTSRATPILGLDVWEHAYYLHYQNRRADYCAAFWNVVNWTQVEANYTAAMKS
jgi:Fe-Mn family superoxide dismutase